jgi:alpha-beta hydrolase superfamily lysophospholipase
VHATTSDGVRLALRRFPAARPRGAALLVHAMMADGGYLAPLAAALAGAGVAAYTLELRGHGRSVPPSPRTASWRFEAYVERDLPAAVAAVAEDAGCAAAELAYLGHSLGGLAGVAAFGTGTAPAPRRLALITASPWILGGPIRLAIAGALAAASRPLGYLPVRALRLGNNDEPAAYYAGFLDWVRRGRWDGPGGVDYLAAAASLRCPTWIVVGAHDRWCTEEDARVMARALGGERTWRTVPGGHFAFFRDRRLWSQLADFMAT